MKLKGIVFILSAPSGTGKTTVGKRIRETLPDLKFAVSHTTRSARQGERDEVDYFFIPQSEFDEMVSQRQFLEWAKVHDHCYGTSFKTVRDNTESGNDILVEVDVQGAETLRKNKFPGIYVFLLPPSLAELATRLQNRGTEKEEIIHKRLEIGKAEIPKYRLYDYVLTNYDVEDTVQELMAIIRAENSRVERYQATAKDIESLLTKGNT